MVTDEMIEAGRRASEWVRVTGQISGDDLRVIYTAMHTARPTADLGDDGEFVDRLRIMAHRFNGGTALPDDELVGSTLLEAADRVELYREALELIAEGKGGKADCIRRFAKAALSRSGG